RHAGGGLQIGIDAPVLVFGDGCFARLLACIGDFFRQRRLRVPFFYAQTFKPACMADCFGVSIDYLACGEKAAVVSVDGLTDEQINLMTELTRALRQQNKGRRGNPKSTPTPERQELVFKRVAQFLK
uniref:hypothetical protein n=1 Tax=Gemmiger formicilis TaxID=745368 RepID=UPI003FF14CB6